MGIITYDLLPKQRPRKHNLNVEIDIYPIATELYEELARIGIIDRVKKIPQLGLIRVPKQLKKTRYDYIMLQLYLHQIIRKNLQGYLKWTYNNYTDFTYGKKEVTIADILQLLTIVYNIGHFYNTLTASRAVTMLASENKIFHDMLMAASVSERFEKAAKDILNKKDYHRLHLLNSILILEQCDQTKQSVLLAQEILYAYMDESVRQEESKLEYAFSVFQKVRNVSYMAYDLQISETPLVIDLCNEKAMLVLLKELLSEYNNNQSTHRLVQSITKLLDDTVYNENSNAICFYKISRKMVTTLKKQMDSLQGKYFNLFIEQNSVLNSTYTQRRDYRQNQILKLTFSEGQRAMSEVLLTDLEKINNTRVGYYDRHNGEQTILVSIREDCDYLQKRLAAFKTMKYAVNSLRKIPGIMSTDARYVLSIKFFLFYLFNENPVLIKPTLDSEKCVICTRGKKTRVRELEKMLSNAIGTEDEKHEVDFLLSQLVSDSINDTSITIPASILVYEKRREWKKLCEFDGMIIHPMRKRNQLIFLEAKNRKEKPSVGKNCLREKLDKFPIRYEDEDIKVINKDACFKYTV